ncbi:hypothetical protein GE09DRAFT_515393 [Coniochaeta sp. 2T2.1]|nr:hypothetical protein GE09DRAFT_515393 [Coniochaeta sp. 2T2.1]
MPNGSTYYPLPADSGLLADPAFLLESQRQVSLRHGLDCVAAARANTTGHGDALIEQTLPRERFCRDLEVLAERLRGAHNTAVVRLSRWRGFVGVLALPLGLLSSVLPALRVRSAERVWVLSVIVAGTGFLVLQSIRREALPHVMKAIQPSVEQLGRRVRHDSVCQVSCLHDSLEGWRWRFVKYLL